MASKRCAAAIYDTAVALMVGANAHAQREGPSNCVCTAVCCINPPTIIKPTHATRIATPTPTPTSTSTTLELRIN